MPTRTAPAGQARRPVNVTLPSQLLEDAKALGLNVSQACESGLSATVAAAKEQHWRDENRAGIEAWNAYVDEHGLPLEEYRQF
jgi:antitoxin CcdA